MIAPSDNKNLKRLVIPVCILTAVSFIFCLMYFHMTIFSIVNLSISTLSILLAFIVFAYSNKKVHQIWSIFNLTIAMWSLALFLVGQSKIPDTALIYWRWTYLWCTFISVVFYHGIIEFCDIKRPRMLLFAYIQGLIFALFILFTDYVVGSTFYIFDSIHYHKATILFAVWLAFWFIPVTVAFIELYGFIKRNKGIQKTRALYLFWGSMLGHIGGATTVIPAFDVQFYPAWHFLICIYTIIMTYAIIRINLLSLEIVIKRSLVYSLTLTVVTITFLVSVLIIEKFSQAVLGYQTSIASILAAILIAIIFSPVRNKIQKIVDKKFFKGTTQELANQNDLLRMEASQKEKFKAVATLASGMAHEIRNPLTAIKTFAEHLPNKKRDEEFLDKFSKIVGKEVQRVDELVQQLLEFARPAPLLLKDVDIHKLLKGTLDFLNNKLIEQHISLKKEFPENEPVIIQADANQLKQAFLNLLLNAIDAMPDGGTLTIGVRVQGLGDRKKPKTNKPKSLHPKPYTLTPKIIISISDTGCGIDKEAQKHIFEPFYSNKDKGTGLGLSITYGIIQEHKGSIAVHSQINKGTAFIIHIPIVKDGES